MMLGLSLQMFTLLHVALSLVGILAGLIVLWGLLTSHRSDGWTAVFLATTVLTSVSGFGFPFTHLLPSHIVGIISLVVLAVAIFAWYGQHIGGVWRPVYVFTATLALYLNVFVLVAQAFLKVPPLHALAPTQAEPPFAIVQGLVLVIFVVLGILALMRSRGFPAANSRPA